MASSWHLLLPLLFECSLWTGQARSNRPTVLMLQHVHHHWSSQSFSMCLCVCVCSTIMWQLMGTTAIRQLTSTHTQLVFETIEPHCNWGAVFVMLVKARHDDNAPHNQPYCRDNIYSQALQRAKQLLLLLLLQQCNRLCALVLILILFRLLTPLLHYLIALIVLSDRECFYF